MIKKIIITTIFIFATVNILVAKDKEQTASQEIPGLPVQTFVIKKQSNTIAKTYPTILKAYEQVEVMARVSGILTEKHFKEGDFVKKGTLLYKIEPDTYLANLNMKKANYTKAKKDYERASSLIESKSISPQVFDEYTYQYQSSKAALDEAQINFDYTSVKSPIDGIAGIKKNDIGDLVGTTSENSILVTITNTNPIHAEFSIPKEDINKYLNQIKSKSVKVKIVTDYKTFENGSIDFVSPTIDSNTDTLLVRAKFENKNNELIVGNFAKLEISNLSLGNVFVVPENAVIKTAQGSIVFVVDKDNIAKVRPVDAGELVKEGIIIRNGLNENEQIVTSNLAKLRPDTKVQVINKKN